MPALADRVSRRYRWAEEDAPGCPLPPDKSCFELPKANAKKEFKKYYASAHKLKTAKKCLPFATLKRTGQTDIPANIVQRFRDLADEWQRETGHMSVTIKRVMHRSYQDIIAMGPRVVPLLIRDLAQTRRDWFWALHHLTQPQADPIETSGAKTKDEMITAWTAWGRKRGLI